MIAGYNTSSESVKAKYDEKKLCRVMGMGVLCFAMGLFLLAINEECIILFYGLFIMGMFICLYGSNRWCKNKNCEVIEEDNPSADFIHKGSIILTVLIFIGVGIMLFSGNVNIEVKDTSLSVSGFLASPTTIEYSDIEDITITDRMDSSTRIGGYGGFRVSTGNFKNDEFGKYKRYTYNDCDTYIVIKAKGKYIVFNMSDEEDTEKYYERILEKWL